MAWEGFLGPQGGRSQAWRAKGTPESGPKGMEEQSQRLVQGAESCPVLPGRGKSLCAQGARESAELSLRPSSQAKGPHPTSRSLKVNLRNIELLLHNRLFQNKARECLLE